MKSEQGQTARVPLGKGRLFSLDTMDTWKRAVTSRSLAMDWAKGRLLTMVISLVVMIFGIGSVLGLVVPGLAGGNANHKSAAGGQEEGAPMEAAARVQDAPNLKLRNDLFDVPKPARKQKPKEPKTNPVELLRLIELQGVLGGANPRAMVLYKRTKETVTVSVGDDLGDFEVVEIRERSVVLKWRNELFELSL